VASRTSSAVTPGPEDHVVEDDAVIRLADRHRLLHRARGEADLAGLDRAALGDLERDQRALYAVGVLDRHVRVLQGQLADRLAGALGGEQPPRRVVDRLVIQSQHAYPLSQPGR
jgi:hypothetical protein